MAKQLGDNCKLCYCSTCIHLSDCDTMCGDTEWYCDNDCKGENGYMSRCNQYEKAPA